jgi:hypothetical protein
MGVLEGMLTANRKHRIIRTACTLI